MHALRDVFAHLPDLRRNEVRAEQSPRPHSPDARSRRRPARSHATFADEMSYCLGCLACQTACPAGVDYATLLENARGEVERQRRGRRTVAAIHSLAHALGPLSPSATTPRLWPRVWLYQKLGVQAAVRALGIPQILPKRLRQLEAMTPTVVAPFSNARIAAASRSRATPKYRVALLTGCVQDLLYAPINRATADVLLANGCEVVTPPVQYCCGSLHAHNGELDLARDLARKNLDLYDLSTARRRHLQRRRLRLASQKVRRTAPRRPRLPRPAPTSGTQRSATSASGL